MVENVTRAEYGRSNYISWASPYNDNRVPPLSMGRSTFPKDAVAHIYKPSRSVMTSGKARNDGWKLRFEPRCAPFIEPLMGWTGTTDTLTQVDLSFPTLDSAVRYAEQQGLTYVVHGTAHFSRPQTSGASGTAHSFSDATLNRLGLRHLRETYARALENAANRSDPSGPENWTEPIRSRDHVPAKMEIRAVWSS